jgi:precorrin-8X/cobalt-precorrin-8 methylmutase
MRAHVPFITTLGSFGGGILASVTLNVLAQYVIDKPHCHCYLSENLKM